MSDGDSGLTAWQHAQERPARLVADPHATARLEIRFRDAIAASDDDAALAAGLAILAELSAALAREEQTEADLRREWWGNHGCQYPAMYGDDGELSCANGHPHHLPLDFKRQPLAELREAVRNARLSRAASVSSVSDQADE